ncbi:MAG: hypothetical protein NXH75_13535, partial [Halobacteriovoraceae bacterium]|nr:hypothetical protein [Halobacteriovoraceae bacterium]
MKWILLITLMICSVNSLAQEKGKRSKRYKIRIAKCMQGTNFKDLSLAGVTQTLQALNCVIDTNSFMKSFLVSEGHPDCKETLRLLGTFKGFKPGSEQEFGVMDKTIKDLKNSQCDLKDEYALKMKTVAITYFEESEARSSIKRISADVQELREAMEPKGQFEIYKAKPDSYLLKYMQRGIEFKKLNEPRTLDEEKYVRLCKYKEEYDEKNKIVGFRSILGEMLGRSENDDPNIYTYKKHGLEFKFDKDGNIVDGFFLPDRVIYPCYKNKLKGKVNKAGYLGHTLECYKTNANLSLCDKKYCEKVLGIKLNSITLCQDYFDKVFLKRREVLGNDFDVMTQKARPLLSKCLVTNTMLLYCDSFLNSYTP